MKSVPEGTSRVAMLKNGEADIAYALDGEDALNVRRDSRLQLVPSKHASIYWIEFAEQWDPKSPWHDKRLRLAVNHALDRKAITRSRAWATAAGGRHRAEVMEFALQAPVTPYDPQRRSSSSPTPAIPTALTPVISRRIRHSHDGRGGDETIWARSGSARRCGRWSARHS